MTAHPERRWSLLDRQLALEASLAHCRTVGDVWAVTEALEAIDAALAADRTGDHMTTESKRYCLVSDDDGHDYVIEVEHRDEWYELDDDAINDGPSWCWPVGGAPNQVTFTNPHIFGVPVEDVPA